MLFRSISRHILAVCLLRGVACLFLCLFLRFSGRESLHPVLVEELPKCFLFGLYVSTCTIFCGYPLSNFCLCWVLGRALFEVHLQMGLPALLGFGGYFTVLRYRAMSTHYMLYCSHQFASFFLSNPYGDLLTVDCLMLECIVVKVEKDGKQDRSTNTDLEPSLIRTDVSCTRMYRPCNGRGRQIFFV